MNRDCFWLTDEQFARIEPHLPTDTRGKPRVKGRRVISGIVYVLKSGGLTRRPCMGQGIPSTIASFAGHKGASGSMCSTPLPMPAGLRPTS